MIVVGMNLLPTTCAVVVFVVAETQVVSETGNSPRG
jgi:hypothetical protein